ncbi:19029_t:CDS:2 [Funneliformis geosporum]|uniref:16476_t:CDS:1 n=1 Tax=Funneliformis geosporum TaxID=1117311 RepID=A0A9W4T0E3_9GLOM|nr:16476_t:CDS:2 [Funneliformis geosporum]CAI2188220.1 19029_t:CDS:2 [Funneliformis geosporum]
MDDFLNGLQFIKPKLLLYCTGSEWTYQSAKTLYKELQYKLKEHYKYFLQKKIDKTYIPIYLFLSGAGMSKSRNAEEFHRTSIDCLSEDKDLKLRKIIENAFVFSVGFENGSNLRSNVKQSVYRAIGTQMLNQLLSDQNLDLIISNYEAPLP